MLLRADVSTAKVSCMVGLTACRCRVSLQTFRTAMDAKIGCSDGLRPSSLSVRLSRCSLTHKRQLRFSSSDFKHGIRAAAQTICNVLTHSVSIGVCVPSNLPPDVRSAVPAQGR